MSAFIDSLSYMSWFLGGQFVGYMTASQNVDENGEPLVGASSDRINATSLAFENLVSVSDNSAQAKIFSLVANAYLNVNTVGELVFSSQGGVVFNIFQKRSQIITLEAVGLGYINYNSDLNSFCVSSESPLMLGLAFPLQSGSKVWTRYIGAEISGSPASFGGMQLVAGSSPLLTCYDTFTGQVHWQYQSEQSATCGAVVNWMYRIVVVVAGFEVMAFSVDNGKLVWNVTISGEVYARPRTLSDIIIITINDGSLLGLSVVNGKQRWIFTTDGVEDTMMCTAATYGNTAYYGSNNGVVYAIDIDTGMSIWSHNNEGFISGTILACQDVLAFGDHNGGVTVLDRVTGSVVWGGAVNSSVVSRPTVLNDFLVVGDMNGGLSFFEINTGLEVVADNSFGTIVSDLAVSDGVIYFTSLEGTLYAVQESSSGPSLNASSIDIGENNPSSVNLFSGSINVSAPSGHVFSYTFGLQEYFNPMDTILLLQVSDIANRVTGGQRPSVPSGWTLVGSCTASNETPYGTAIILYLRRPSDDQMVLVIAFGVEYESYLNFYMHSRVSLEMLPAEIIGDVDQIGVTKFSLDNYISMRGEILNFISAYSNVPVVVTGYAEGGVLAAIASLDLCTPKNDTPNFPDIRYVSFGTPAPGDANFSSVMESSSVSVSRVIISQDRLVTSLGSPWVQLRSSITVGQGVFTAPGVVTIKSYVQAMNGII